MKCETCGAPVRELVTFCTYCGGRLEAPTQPTQPPTIPPFIPVARPRAVSYSGDARGPEDFSRGRSRKTIPTAVVLAVFLLFVGLALAFVTSRHDRARTTMNFGPMGPATLNFDPDSVQIIDGRIVPNDTFPGRVIPHQIGSRTIEWRIDSDGTRHRVIRGKKR